jgi:hypothetical protein
LAINAILYLPSNRSNINQQRVRRFTQIINADRFSLPDMSTV